MNTDTHSILDLSYLEMMADGDAFMKKTMIDMLIEELPAEVTKLRQAFLEQHADNLRNVAHKMKSTLAFVGHPAMTVANSALEDIGREATDLQRASVHLGVMERYAPQVLAALQAESDAIED